MRIAFFSYMQADSYFRIHMLKSGSLESCHQSYFIQIHSMFRYAIHSFNSTNNESIYECGLLNLIKEFRRLDLIVFATPLSSWKRAWLLKFLLRPKKLSFDYYDDLYFGQESLKARIYHSVWALITDFVIVLNPILSSRFKKTVEINNASHLIKGTVSPQKTVGIISNIGRRFEFSLIRQVLKEVSDYNVHLYGRIAPHLRSEEKNRIEWEITDCSKNKRFKYFGEYKPSELPTILEGFHVGLIPYLINEETIFINPDKYYHYTNFGLNVIAPPIPSLVNRSNVIFFIDGDDLIRKLKSYETQEVDLYYSWKERFQSLVEALN